MEKDDILRGIGCFVVAVSWLAVPVLCGVSFILWTPFVSIILSLATLLEVACVTIDLYHDKL